MRQIITNIFATAIREDTNSPLEKQKIIIICHGQIKELTNEELEKENLNVVKYMNIFFKSFKDSIEYYEFDEIEKNDLSLKKFIEQYEEG